MINVAAYDALLLQHEFDWKTIPGKKARYEARHAFENAIPEIARAVTAGDLDTLTNRVATLRAAGIMVFSMHVGRQAVDSAYETEAKKRWFCFTEIGSPSDKDKVLWIQVWHDKNQ